MSLAIIAPMSGPLVPLENVPDPVFAQKMVGDGISIDPVSEQLIAPCDGKIVQLHRACHAVTVEASNGLQIMMHIGIDTVGLEGVGFQPRVAMGDTVVSGQTLIEFDADFVAAKAKSLLTQIIVVNSDEVAKFDYASGFAHAGKDMVLMLTPSTAKAESADSDAQALTSDDVIVPNPTGLHARPAAMLVAESKKFKSSVHLYKGSDHANAKSLVSIMGLGVNCGDHVNVVAKGNDAEAAIAAIAPLIASGLGEDCPPIGETALVAEPTEETEPAALSTDPNIVLGVTASPGLAIGRIFHLKREEIEVTEASSTSPANERQSLDKAVKAAFAQLDALQAKVDDKEKAAIFAAHQALLDDPELLDYANDLIEDGKSAAFAWRSSYLAQAKALANLKNELLAARANDLRDVGRRVLQAILGIDPEADDVPENTILVAEDLTPSDTANLDRSKVLGFCTMTGGASSHVAILARSMNLPAIAGIEARVLKVADGTEAILDAESAQLRLNPAASDVDAIRSAQVKMAEKHQHDLAHAQEPAATKDGHRLEVVANVANAKDAAEGVTLGAEGVGLLRSEFLFMNRATAPTEEEQTQVYKDIVQALKPGQPLIIRTLDVGGDKPLPYLPIAPEENPFLGLRGIRVSLQKTALFRVQLRAILKAASAGHVHIMFPMITTIEDLRSAKTMLEEERLALGAKAIPVGIMVEVPSTAVLAERFAAEVDFFSIGTNDLTQYTLAIDRGHPSLAAQADGLNPAVLQLIANTVKGAHAHKKWVGVCGGIASDPLAVPILLGIGVDELSVSVPSVPEIKARVREFTLAECQSIAEQALQQSSAHDVRQLMQAQETH